MGIAQIRSFGGKILQVLEGPMDRYPGKRICVVGAGIAGLVTAKVLRDDGFDVVVFEKQSVIGGVWTVGRTYPGLRTNGPRETYAFSDFPYPETADDFPTAEQVRTYLESYADGMCQALLDTELGEMWCVGDLHRQHLWGSLTDGAPGIMGPLRG